MKKKILFMVINMNVGGTEKALLNMISEMPRDKYDITILMLEKYGGFLDSVPKEVNVEYVKNHEKYKDVLNKPPKVVILNFLKQLKLVKAFTYLILYLISQVLEDRSILFKYLLRHYKSTNTIYDVAVAYAGPMDFISYFVINKIKSKKKIQWIHFDINKIGFNTKFSAKIYSRFDNIFVVSEEGKGKLLKKIPMLKERTVVFHNVVSSEIIRKQSKLDSGFDDSFKGIRILTVGRLSKEKGQDLAIRVLARFIEYGYKVKWYCVGEGNSRREYEELIDKYKLNDHFVLLGAKTNPYPYIDQCDIYVQPSRYEGYCITLIEARCLNKPIVTTDVNGAKEQIQDGENGVIVNFDEKELYGAIISLISDKKLRTKFSKKLSEESIEAKYNIGDIF